MMAKDKALTISLDNNILTVSDPTHRKVTFDFVPLIKQMEKNKR